VSPGPYRTIIPYNDIWILLELSSDTVYYIFTGLQFAPFLTRTPSIQPMDPEVFLLLRFFSDRYYFMETIKNAFDFNTGAGFPRTFFMYDKQEKAFFKYKLFNGDYSIQKRNIYERFKACGSRNRIMANFRIPNLLKITRKGN
jgi:hypothetical protein